MPRYKLTIEYDGTPYAGWQRQKDVLSVQEAIETAIYGFCQQQVSLTCAGRTDAGVHALGQVAHVDLVGDYSCFRIMEALNAHLRREAVSIVNVEAVPDTFNARFDATKRRYRYRIITRRAPLVMEHNRAWQIIGQLDLGAMREAAAYLIGHHDFTSFRDSQCQANSPMRTLDRLDITQTDDIITLELEALSFLHHQVRIITGTLVDIGRGKYPPATIQDILAARSRPAAGPTAPACGLYFVEVWYTL